MRSAERLTERRDFTAVYQGGKPYRSDVLIVRALRSGQQATRVGYVAGRVVGNAVVRNRVKRRLREAVRSLELAPGWDVVISARKGASEIRYEKLRSTVAALLARAGVTED